MIRVWLTGQWLINKRFNKAFPLHIFDAKKEDKDDRDNVYDISTYINNVAAKEGSHKKKKLNASSKCEALFEGEEEAIWCIIALTHDLGYPLGKIEKINDSIKKMIRFFAKTKMEEFNFLFPPQNQFINDAILSYMSSKIVLNKADSKLKKNYSDKEFNTHRQAKFYLKFSRSFERFDHGLISCIVLAKNLIYFLETNYDFDSIENLKGIEEARQYIIRREMLRAIAAHTCHEIYHFQPNTFSFLLLFVDELQFWGRPTFETMRSGVDKEFKITLENFSNNEISFSIKSNAKRGYKKESLGRFFLDKVDMFKKILRTAVDATGRPFKFKFKVLDELNKTYEFILETPEKSKRPTIYVNNRKIKSYSKLKNLIESGL